jgi:propionyl-CoA synthetase
MDQLACEIISLVREMIGPIAALQRVIAVDRLPKTRSGKLLRATMKRILDGEDYTIPATIEDPTVLAEIEMHASIREQSGARELTKDV